MTYLIFIILAGILGGANTFYLLQFDVPLWYAFLLCVPIGFMGGTLIANFVNYVEGHYENL